MIKHLQRFGINVDEGFPEADEDGKYPNDDDAGTDTNSPDEIDEMITDEDVDPDTVSDPREKILSLPMKISGGRQKGSGTKDRNLMLSLNCRPIEWAWPRCKVAAIHKASCNKSK